ncbi:ATP-dependent RNA helicase PB1A10.06c [Pyrus ussuriensis x Pyrus communis]|uniref:RNA helicase n=1 Tax=Pyrus ussuriensis x Pyrus communis TaxID=2448454 RepID=A0A5N5H5E2_9ROSA|nr:ATP-dependent RNA helicase PB1A10.06c [Pyrus ussuriensis x Pyrus communis]
MENIGYISLYGGVDSNALVLPAKRGNKRKGTNQGSGKPNKSKAPMVSKSQQRKLKKLEDEKEKALSISKSIEALEKYELPEAAYSLLQSSKNIGKVESKKEKRQKAVLFSKAGFEAFMIDPQPFNKVDSDHTCSESEPEVEKTQSRRDIGKNDLVQSKILQKEIQKKTSFSLDSSQGQVCGRGQGINGRTAAASSVITNAISNRLEMSSQQDTNISPTSCVNGDNEISKTDHIKETPKANVSRVSKSSISPAPRPLISPTIVHVSRPEEVENTRKDLPIIMMEQEVMEAVNDHSTVIICGETGCGKTTQVPQFLFEAGFGSSSSSVRSGIIGVTQPRRVAVLATANRVAYELGLHLGKEVGFQVRYDKRIGESCSIKFMTDGILLRELQNDFLLKRYSVIILDEAHERSLNTDILIGMLSRVIRTREDFSIELVLMSATLRVEDFISGKKLFHDPPPVIEVPTRQFPVSIHFSKRTKEKDYIEQAYKKVLAIHKRLPHGGILVFVTGQREVEYLCQKLHRASKAQIIKTSKGDKRSDASEVSEINSAEEIDMKEINEAFEVHGSSEGHQTDRFSSIDEDQYDIDEDELYASYDSETGSELESFGEDGDSLFHDIPENDSNVAEVLGEEGGIASLKTAFEALAGKTSLNSNSDVKEPISDTVDSCNPSMGKKCGFENNNYPGGLHVLPLYAMLPAAAQLRVFEEVKEGERLVVVATNVAETSLTIPGIKYVVDTGKEKVKNYNSSSGMETYEVQWISKASAAQRAGRAGRTGPGHCYRLYSSAAYSNIFPDFSLAEISKVPVDGVVLLMKSMNIDKVSNFPFPTPPDGAALDEAERCLKILQALDKGGRLTPLGRAMAHYPMSPRHARMLLTVVQVLSKKKSSGANLVLAYAVAAAAALSLSNPFVRQFEDSHKESHELNKDGNIKVIHKLEKLGRKKLKETVKMFREKFSNPSSDALSVAFALQCYELAESPVEFCNANGLHPKTMEEMSKLRKQLLQLVFNQSGVSGGENDFSCTFGSREDVEHVWRVSHGKIPLSLYEEELLRQAICAGWADRVAKRIRGSSGSSEGDRKVHAVRYQACMLKERVFLHRWSSVSNSAPEFLVYSELIQTRRPYMHGVTSVKTEWLVEYARSLCTFSAPPTDTKPYYEPLNDRVLHYVIPAFGPHLWELPLHTDPIEDYKDRVSVFAYGLLNGQVLPCLRCVLESMAAPPATVLRPEAAGQARVGNLLAKLRMKKIDSCAMLRKVWKENPSELKTEMLDWFQESFRRKYFETLWSQMHIEVLLEPEERFPKTWRRSTCLDSITPLIKNGLQIQKLL